MLQPLSWAHDQGKGMERCGLGVQPMNRIHIPGSVGECEAMNPHTSK
jgi:hypothetical protein